MTGEREYIVEHTVRMVVTELVTASTAKEAVRLARAGRGEAVGAEVADVASTNWNAHRASRTTT